MSGKTKQQEVRDEQGRRRFHGAFTGGFSAGYFNSVGTAEGWTPSTFKSSRQDRASTKQTSVEDFMDEDDGLLGRDLQTQLPYDTLGKQAHQLMKQQAERQASESVIPGPIVDEFLAPMGVAIGKKLLEMMGWKEGIGIGSRQHRRKRTQIKGPSEELADDDAEDLPEAMRSTLRPDVVQQGKISFARPDIGVIGPPAPKNDMYGLGFDPDNDAPEFRALRNSLRNSAHHVVDRGVYRMSDVTGKSSSSRAGQRDATGFALLDDEDDVYDSLATSNGKAGSQYYTDLGAGEEEDEIGPSKSVGSGRRKALNDWIRGGGTSEGNRPGAHSRCPTDGRPVPEGFRLGEDQIAYRQPFWVPPDPPRNFVPYHRFDENDAELGATLLRRKEGDRGRLVASSRGELLGEKRPMPLQNAEGKTVNSVFDLMSEADRNKVLGKAVGVRPQATSIPSAQLPVEQKTALAQNTTVFQGMQGALAKRFSVVEAKATNDQRAQGLSEGGYKDGIRPSGTTSEPAGLQAAPIKPLKDPTRSQGLWTPAALLCKRFGVPVPQHAKLAPPAGRSLQGAASSASRPTGVIPTPSVMSNKFEKEMQALLPGGGRLAEAEQAAANVEQSIPQSGQQATDANIGPEDIALPAFEQKPRPPRDFFRAIFEASDDEDEEESESGGEGGEEQQRYQQPQQQQLRTVDGDLSIEGPFAGTPPDVKHEPTTEAVDAALSTTHPIRPAVPLQDHFLQPAAVSGESMDDLLAKGPTFVKKNARKRPRPNTEQSEGEEEDGPGLVFGSAVVKRPSKYHSKLDRAPKIAQPQRTGEDTAMPSFPEKKDLLSAQPLSDTEREGKNGDREGSDRDRAAERRKPASESAEAREKKRHRRHKSREDSSKKDRKEKHRREKKRKKEKTRKKER